MAEGPLAGRIALVTGANHGTPVPITASVSPSPSPLGTDRQPHVGEPERVPR
jgi:hypothetical protein